MQTHELAKLWHYRLFTIGNQDMLVSNLSLVIIMIWVGLRYHKQFSLKVQSYVTNYLQNSDKTAAYIIQKAITSAAILIYASFILDIANVPLSTFAFLGGTVALSIGLGAQTLIGNFLSGFVVVVERSLKIGDIVEIDGIVGRVEAIGIRSTIIKTFCESSVIIPNSNFMHHMFTKLKSHNGVPEVCAYIKIKDAGMVANEVEQKILDCLLKADFILQKPAPTVHLSEVSSKEHVYAAKFYPKQNNKSISENALSKALLAALESYDIDIKYPYELKVKKEK